MRNGLAAKKGERHQGPAVWGRRGEVTGSSYVVESGKSKVLVDCGMFQGVPNADQKNRIAQEFSFRNLSAVVMTHAHLDGRVPILAQRKFTRSVYVRGAKELRRVP